MLATHLMTWHSVWVAYEKLVGAGPGEADRYFVESARAAKALGLDLMSKDEFRAQASTLGYDPSLIDEHSPVIPQTRAQVRQFYAMLAPRTCVTPGSSDIVNTLLRPPATTAREALEYRAYGVLSDAAAALLPRNVRALASLPTGRRWETRAILAGRAAVHAIDLAPVKGQFEQSVSPAGYRCMHAAQRTQSTSAGSGLGDPASNKQSRR